MILLFFTWIVEILLLFLRVLASSGIEAHLHVPFNASLLSIGVLRQQSVLHQSVNAVPYKRHQSAEPSWFRQCSTSVATKHTCTKRSPRISFTSVAIVTLIYVAVFKDQRMNRKFKFWFGYFMFGSAFVSGIDIQ